MLRPSRLSRRRRRACYAQLLLRGHIPEVERLAAGCDQPLLRCCAAAPQAAAAVATAAAAGGGLEPHAGVALFWMALRPGLTGGQQGCDPQQCQAQSGSSQPTRRKRSGAAKVSTTSTQRTSHRASSCVPACPKLCLEVSAASSGRHRQTTPSDEPAGGSHRAIFGVSLQHDCTPGYFVIRVRQQPRFSNHDPAITPKQLCKCSPDATMEPSGDQATRMTESACPWNAATCVGICSGCRTQTTCVSAGNFRIHGPPCC